MKTSDYARLAAGAGLDKKALDPVVLDLRELSSVAEYFILLTGTSNTHVQAIAENITDAFKAVGLKLIGEEGLRYGKWVLLDYGEIVVHVFLESIREYYDLEKLWSDAPLLDLQSSGEETV